MSVDPHLNANPGIDGPANSGFAVTPSDTADLAFYTRAIYVGTSGNVKVDFVGSGSGVTLTGVSGLLQVRVKRIYSTGTTASNITALY